MNYKEAIKEQERIREGESKLRHTILDIGDRASADMAKAMVNAFEEMQMPEEDIIRISRLAAGCWGEYVSKILSEVSYSVHNEVMEFLLHS